MNEWWSTVLISESPPALAAEWIESSKDKGIRNRMLRLHASPLTSPTLLLVAVIGPAEEQLAKNNRSDIINIVIFIIPFMNE